MKWLERLLKSRLDTKDMSNLVETIQVNMTNGETISSSMISLGSTKTVGEALTDVIDSRKDKSMHLIGYKIKQ